MKNSRIYILVLSISIIISCLSRKIEWSVPKPEIKKASIIDQQITANFKFIAFDKYNSIVLQFKNNSPKNQILNDFLFPDSYLKVEKKSGGSFIDISKTFFKMGDFSMIDDVSFGEGDSIVSTILGDDRVMLNNKVWFKNHDNFKGECSELMQYFKKEVDLDSFCIIRFLNAINRFDAGQEIKYHIYINKNFVKGTVYKIYLQYPPLNQNNENTIFCKALFYQLPNIERL
jgi:hypothetical protein